MRVGQNGTSSRARVAIKERVRGVCFLLEGTAEENANALLNGGPVSVQIEKVAALMLPIADTSYVEATWVMIVKSLVIFGVIFAICR